MAHTQYIVVRDQGQWKTSRRAERALTDKSCFRINSVSSGPTEKTRIRRIAQTSSDHDPARVSISSLRSGLVDGCVLVGRITGAPPFRCKHATTRKKSDEPQFLIEDQKKFVL